MDSKTALSELKAFQGSRKGAGDYYTQYQNELGVGDAQARSNDIRGLIRNTEGALKGVNSSVAGRTRGQGVNEAQRARLEGIERAPIAEELGTLQGSFADEQQNYRDLLGQATTRAGQSYQTDADKLAGLESNYNKIYQNEQAAAEQARWQKQFEEQNRQFEAQMAASERQRAATQAQIASLNSRYNAVSQPIKPAPATVTNPQPTGIVNNKNGQVLGYDFNNHSYQTDEGNKQAEEMDKNARLIASGNPLSKIYGNYRNFIQGWLGY